MEVERLVNDLKDFLLADEVGENIAKIFLFGSQAKDAATPNSDIDILIVTNDGEARERRLLDRVYDFMIENNAPIEVMTAHINDLAVMQDYFLYNVVTYGVEVYTVEDKN
jgi:predicted nucleotidyltransferase